MDGSLLPAASPFVLSIATVIIAVLCNLVRQRGASDKRPWRAAVTRDSVLRLLGIRLGDVPTFVVRDGAAAVDALVRRADAFSDSSGGPSTTLSGGRFPNITSMPYGPRWVALRRNLHSEAFHPVRGLARAAPQRARVAAALVDDIAARGSGGVVPVRECLYAALFALNVATCFGDGVVSGEQVEVMRVAQQEFLSLVPSFRVFKTFHKVARLLYADRWKQMVQCRRRQEELYIPLIRACQERRRRRTPGAATTSYVDTLLDVEVPTTTEGAHRRRTKLCEGEMVSLVSEYLGAATGNVEAALEWALANLVRRPDIQSRLRREVEAAGGEAAACAYLRAVVMESLRRHPPQSAVQRHVSSDVTVGGTAVAAGTMVVFSLEDIGRDAKIWTCPEEFIPDRFMPGGEGADVRLNIGNKEATKAKMMPFGAGRRICPGMEYAILNLEYFLAKLVTAFEWHPIKGEKVDLTPEHAFFTTMKHPLRARVVVRRTTVPETL